MISPIEFKEQFLRGIRLACAASPPGLIEQQSEFVVYDEVLLGRYGVNVETADFLASAGLPRQAAPFLDFTAYDERELQPLYAGGLPDAFFLLGGNGSGDPLGIETTTQAVVYFNHDFDMQRIFINSSIPQFAEALCLFQAFLLDANGNAFLKRLGAIDEAAIGYGSMWATEVEYRARRKS